MRIKFDIGIPYFLWIIVKLLYAPIKLIGVVWLVVATLRYLGVGI